MSSIWGSSAPGGDGMTARRQRVPAEWTGPATAVPDVTLPELVAGQVARTPDSVAVVCGESQLTFAELDARAGMLADRLTGLGAGPEQAVGVAMERSVELVVVLLAVLKAGGAYLPL